MEEQSILFDRLQWRDPINGSVLEPIVTARTPAGGPICGALRRSGTPYAYPIVDCIARLTPDLAYRHAEWLKPLGFQPPPVLGEDAQASFQPEATVESFGFQWAWNSAMRSEADLRWRVAERFKVSAEMFAGKTVLDAGAGAGDQSSWLLDQGASVVSIDLSSAIEVVAHKLRLRPNWVGAQGDITRLPFANDQIDIVYCEGVIQHTRDSALTVRELCRTLRGGGMILATHYQKPTQLHWRIKQAYLTALRSYLSHIERFQLLWLTGNLAALAYAPLVSWFVRKSGIAIWYKLMPDFKTTWTNTFDMYGSHTYQRLITPEEFWRYFEVSGEMGRIYQDHTLVVAQKI